MIPADSQGACGSPWIERSSPCLIWSPVSIETPGFPRTQEARTAATRGSLIAAAIACIARLGYADTTTTAIADHAGVSRGALQYHFASKADLIVAVIDTVGKELNFRFDVNALSNMPLEERLDAMLERFWQVFSGPMFRAALSIWLAIGAEPELFSRLKSRLESIREAALITWSAVLSDVGCSDERLASIRRIVMATARGYAISLMFDPSRRWTDDVAELRNMIVNALRQES